MHKVIGPLFTVFVLLAAVFAFSARKGPPMPATEVAIGNALLLDAQRAGKRLVSVGERGYIFVSDDQGSHWRRVPSGTEATLTALAFADDRVGLAVGHDALILRTEDGGLTWKKVFSAQEQMRPLLKVAFVGPGKAFALGAYGAFLESSDGGLNWTERQVMEGDRHLNAVARLDDGTLLMAGEAGTLLRSSDGGMAWQKIASPYAGSYFGLLPVAKGGALAFGMRGKIFRSDDAGISWQEVNTDNEASLFGGWVMDDQSLLLVGQNGTALLSRDHGRSFVRVPAKGNRLLSAVLPAFPGGDFFVFGEGGFARIGAPAGAGK